MDGRTGLDEPLFSEAPPGTLLAPGSPPRRTRDVGWLVALIFYWVGMVFVARTAISEGNIGRLTAGMDYTNNLCGPNSDSEELRKRPYVYYSCLQYGSVHPTICVAECPRISGHYVKWYNNTLIDCRLNGRVIPATTYPTTNLQHNCVPSASSLYALVSNAIDETTFPSVLAGMHKASTVIVMGTFAAALLAAIWVCSLRFLATSGNFSIVTVLLGAISLVMLSAALWLRVQFLQWAIDNDFMPELQGSFQVATNKDMAVGLAILTSAFALGVAVALWCGLHQRLMQAGGIIREAADAVALMPSLLLIVPPLLALGVILLFGYWLLVSLFIASAGSPVCGLLRFDSRLPYFFIYHTAGVLWTAEALLHLGQCATAGVIVRWYFGSSETVSPVAWRGSRAVLQCVGRTLRYSSGSLALGALLVIPGRCFRFFLEHCLHQAQTDARGKPELRDLASFCLCCCIDNSARYLQYMSHNAYILVAMHDVSFCEGAQQAFTLTLSNIGQVSLLTAGERLLLTLAKLSISCVCTAGAAVALPLANLGAADNASGALLLTFIVTFNAADAWIGVLDAAVEAIFLCYLVDQAENDGDTRPYYASATLRRYMDRHRPSNVVLPSASLEDDELRYATGDLAIDLALPHNQPLPDDQLTRNATNSHC